MTIGAPFAAGKFEVSFAEWDACVTDKGCTYKLEAMRERGSQPVFQVSWDDITKEYLSWLSRKTGKTYRLLSEAEWEYAARAGTTGPFSFEGNISPENANYDATFRYDGGPEGVYRQKRLAVRSFAPNAWGLYQLHGNVTEWTAECYVDSYQETPRDGSPVTAAGACLRVARGGSWNDLPRTFGQRTATRASPTPGTITASALPEPFRLFDLYIFTRFSRGPGRSPGRYKCISSATARGRFLWAWRAPSLFIAFLMRSGATRNRINRPRRHRDAALARKTEASEPGGAKAADGRACRTRRRSARQPRCA